MAGKAFAPLDRLAQDYMMMIIIYARDARIFSTGPS
jgi:hypothetical protein